MRNRVGTYYVLKFFDSVTPIYQSYDLFIYAVIYIRHRLATVLALGAFFYYNKTCKRTHIHTKNHTF